MRAPPQGPQKDFAEGELVCRIGMKRCYFGVAEANAMKAHRERGGAPELFIYRCDVCGFLHLTKKRPS